MFTKHIQLASILVALLMLNLLFQSKTILNGQSYSPQQFPIVLRPSQGTMQNTSLARCTWARSNLSEIDRAHYERCCTMSKSEIITGDCEFMSGERRAPVVLVSLPGSGNTWIRGLLEKATGICTGSIYCDIGLRSTGFSGESVRSGSVLVVKSHRIRNTWMDKSNPQTNYTNQGSFGAAIVLLRNPYHVMLAEWNRQRSKTILHNRKPFEENLKNILLRRTQITTRVMASHLGAVNQQHFDPDNKWNSFIDLMMGHMSRYIENVLFKSPRDLPKLVVRYEDFQRDRVGEVSRVLDFLHFPYSRETLSQRLEEDFTTFHRSRHTEFEAFTQSQEQFIDHSLRQILDSLSARNNGETYGIEEYLRT